MPTNQKQHKKKGMTLIELIVAMAIMAVVLGTIYTFFAYNTRLFQKSNALSQVQFDVRLAVDTISNALRNVNEISITDALDHSFDATSLKQTYPSIQTVSFELSQVGEKYMVAITVSGNDDTGRNDYEITTNIMLNNVTNTSTGSGDTLYYK